MASVVLVMAEAQRKSSFLIVILDRRGLAALRSELGALQ
jgi:hypothetical protein